MVPSFSAKYKENNLIKKGQFINCPSIDIMID